MENSIEIFNHYITKLDTKLDINKTYVTDGALRYFFTIRNELEEITDDLVRLLTGTQPFFTLESSKLTMEFADNIDNLENFLKIANKNIRKNKSMVIDVKDILIRFENIRCLMIHPDTNGNFRRDAIKLFIKTGNLYPEEQIKEFIGYLKYEELKYILQIVDQEKTLLEKPLTNSPIHILAIQRINNLALKISKKDKTDIGEER